jgi:lipopolysaccharide/colanic/teichoic acid biosynthesis glycosyltransferase
MNDSDITHLILRFIKGVAGIMLMLCIWGKTLEYLSKSKCGYDSFYNKYVKRLFDIVISGTALLFLWPLYLVIALIIVMEDGFPVFYRAERGGYNNKSFRICKFRSMVKNADKIGGGTTALHDPRITRIGNVLRKTKCDEIPQLWQVFTGKMSLVGPRPELLRYTEQYEGDNRDILKVRPGITDYSSVEFINLDEVVGGENADEMYEKYVLDKKNILRVKYARTVSFRTDFYILFKTLAAVGNKAFGFAVKKEHR